MFEKQHQFFKLVRIIFEKDFIIGCIWKGKGGLLPKKRVNRKADFLDEFGYSSMASIKKEERPNFKCIVCRIEYNNHDQTYHYRDLAWITC